MIALFAIVPVLMPKAIGAEWPYAVLVANHTTDADVYMYVYTSAGKEEAGYPLSLGFRDHKRYRLPWTGAGKIWNFGSG
jgi:hypothetical protein